MNFKTNKKNLDNHNIFVFFIPDHTGFYRTVWKLPLFFSIKILTESHDLKSKCFQQLHKWKVLRSKFSWYGHDLWKILIHVLAFLPSGMWKYLKVHFPKLLKDHYWKTPAIIYMEFVAINNETSEKILASL